MFKQPNIEDELYRSMESSLVKNQREDKHGLDKLSKAIDLLNTASTIFVSAGMHAEAEEITEILRCLAQDVK